jgi:hypothetical protein
VCDTQEVNYQELRRLVKDLALDHYEFRVYCAIRTNPHVTAHDIARMVGGSPGAALMAIKNVRLFGNVDIPYIMK